MRMIKRLPNDKHLNSVIAQVGSSGIAMVSLIILARTMPQETFGKWGLFLAVLTFVDHIKSGLVTTALIKYSSGETIEKKEALLASSWILNLISMGIISVVCYSILFTGVIKDESISLFLLFYPIYGIISMPYFYNVWNSQIDINMGRMAKIRILSSTLFLIVCLISLAFEMTLFQLVAGYVGTFFISSVISVLTGRTGINKLRSNTKNEIKRLYLFGRFHMLVFLGGKMLRSSDTFLISAFLGYEALAIYLIPQRLWMLVIMPLASAVTVCFPIISSNHNNKKYKALKMNIEKYIGVMTLLYIPFAILLFFLAEPLVLLIGGEKYLAAVELFRIFLIYSIFVPFDQIMGVSLDAVDRPNKNFLKVSVMAIVNIVGDLIVLEFYGDIYLVAWVTLATTLSGVLAGYFMLKEVVNINIISIFKNGYRTLLRFFRHLTKTKSFQF